MVENNPLQKYKILSLPYLFQSETPSVLSTLQRKRQIPLFPEEALAHTQAAQSIPTTQQICFSEKERKPLSIKALYHSKAPGVPIATRCVKCFITVECFRVKTRTFSSSLTANLLVFYYPRKDKPNTSVLQYIPLFFAY